MPDSSDQIHLHAIRVQTRIGVPDGERATPQTVEIDLTLIPTRDFRDLGDDIAQTVDYHAVWLRVHAIAAARPRKLVETLAEDLAQQLLAGFPGVNRLRVEIRKFILPETGSVAVSIWRDRENP